jgi:hypothetical protein
MAAAAASLFDNFCILDRKFGAVCPNSNSHAFPRVFPVINNSTATPKPTVPLLVRKAG